MSNVIPLFKSHYSIGKSILTLDKAGSSTENGSNSIIDICLNNGLKELFLVDNSMGGFLEGYLNAKAAGIRFRFGLRISVSTAKEKDEDSLGKTSKYIIFAKNRSGYQKLIKIYTFAAKEGFYYEPRIDFDTLKGLWSEEDLTLGVPFYDSFLHLNSLKGSLNIPDFNFCKPLFFYEENDIPFNFIIKKHIDKYCKDKYEILKAKSIYYHKKEDFKAFLSFRCISERTCLDKPNLEHMTSNEFSFENWKEQSNG